MGDKDFIRSTSLYEGMNQKDDKGNFLLAPLPLLEAHSCIHR